MTGVDGPDEPRPAGENGRRGRSESVSVAAFAGLGLQFVVAILLFLYLGHWVDQRIGTSPLFLITGVFVGAGAAFYSIYRRLTAEQRREEAERAGGRDRR